MNKILLILMLLCIVTNTSGQTANNSQKTSDSLSVNQDEGERMRKELYKSLIVSYGKDVADRLMAGKLAWGDEEDAVLLAHRWEQPVTVGHYGVETPLGKATEWHFGASNITCYFINNKLIGIIYPAKHPTWMPRFSDPAENKNKDNGYTSEYDHIEYTKDTIVSHIDNFISSMNEEVKGYYRKAKSGNAKAQFQLGACLQDGDGVTQSDKEAVYWYNKSANGGNLWGIYNLAICYSNGEGVKRNDAKALFWFKKAANRGDHDSQYQLAKLYYNSFYLPNDYAKAVFWFKKATLSTEKDIKALSYHYLYLCYRYGGKGIKQNISLSNNYNRKAKAFGYYEGLEEEY